QRARYLKLKFKHQAYQAEAMRAVVDWRKCRVIREDRGSCECSVFRKRKAQWRSQNIGKVRPDELFRSWVQSLLIRDLRQNPRISQPLPWRRSISATPVGDVCVSGGGSQSLRLAVSLVPASMLELPEAKMRWV